MIFFFCFVIELPNNSLHFFKMFLFFNIVQNQTQMFTVFRIRKKYGNILIFRYQRLFLRVFLSLYQFNQFRLLAILLSSPICCPFDRFSSIRFSGLLCRNGDKKKQPKNIKSQFAIKSPKWTLEYGFVVSRSYFAIFFSVSAIQFLCGYFIFFYLQKKIILRC